MVSFQRSTGASGPPWVYPHSLTVAARKRLWNSRLRVQRSDYRGGAVGKEIREKCDTMRPSKLSRSDTLTHFTSADSPSSEKKPTPPRLNRLSVQELINWPLTEVRKRPSRTLTRTR